MVDLGEIQLEYMDFGGEGIPFIWVQDFHNYFEGPYSKHLESPLTIDLFAKISKVQECLLHYVEVMEKVRIDNGAMMLPPKPRIFLLL
jgi:hypothetical protein